MVRPAASARSSWWATSSSRSTVSRGRIRSPSAGARDHFRSKTAGSGSPLREINLTRPIARSLPCKRWWRPLCRRCPGDEGPPPGRARRRPFRQPHGRKAIAASSNRPLFQPPDAPPHAPWQAPVDRAGARYRRQQLARDICGTDQGVAGAPARLPEPRRRSRRHPHPAAAARCVVRGASGGTAAAGHSRRGGRPAEAAGEPRRHGCDGADPVQFAHGSTTCRSLQC